MKKLFAVLLAMVMLLGIVPALAEIDTSEHVKIVYLVTGDKPTNRTDEVLAKINELLTEKINAEEGTAAEAKEYILTFYDRILESIKGSV